MESKLDFPLQLLRVPATSEGLLLEDVSALADDNFIPGDQEGGSVHLCGGLGEPFKLEYNGFGEAMFSAPPFVDLLRPHPDLRKGACSCIRRVACVHGSFAFPATLSPEITSW